jgi:hypothetical protein
MSGAAGHDPDHAGQHEISADADRRYLSIALGLLVAFMNAVGHRGGHRAPVARPDVTHITTVVRMYV